MILEAAGEFTRGRVLDVGCGIGAYLRRLAEVSPQAFGLEFDAERSLAAGRVVPGVVVRGAAERLPFASGSLDLVLSHEVIEHVDDDKLALEEIARVLRRPDPASSRPGGRLVLFVPNRWYPFETHGVYWRGRYRFGNIPLVNYLPRTLRDRLAPHVRAYTRRDLERLFTSLPLRLVQRTVIFGAYDNIIARWPSFGRSLRAAAQTMERTPLRAFGLSHLWVAERI